MPINNDLKEEYINAHRHDWDMHKEADWWIEKIHSILREVEAQGRKEARAELAEKASGLVIEVETCCGPMRVIEEDDLTALLKEEGE